MTKRAGIYARYSSEEQTGGESIEYQLEQCKDHITKQGWSLSEVFVDRAKSGTTTYRREEFNRMVALAKAKDRPFDVVVAWSTSRFGRNMDECAVNKAFLRKHGVEVHFVSQPLPEGHVGKLIEKIFEWTDELQSIQIGEYAFQGQKQVTQKGFHGGGKAPHGYKRVRVADPDGKRDKDGKVVEYVTYEVVEEQAEIVRRVFRIYAEGSSYKSVAHVLNTEGIQSPGGSTWDVSSVRTVLLNENYLGHRVWNQTRRNKKVQRGTKVPKPREEWVIKENAHEAIVNKPLWEAVQERMRQNRRPGPRGSHWTPRSPALLTGIIRCAECDANYHRNTIRSRGVARHYYRCGYHSKRGNAVCANGRSLQGDQVEKATLDLLSNSLLTTANVEAVIATIGEVRKSQERATSAQELKVRSGEIDREIRNLTAAIKEGGPIGSLVKELQACESRQADLSKRAQEAALSNEPIKFSRAEVELAIRDLKNVLEHRPPEERKILLKRHIKQIRVSPKGPALLETNPTGLLASLGVCEFLVTPRGVAMKERSNLIPFPEDQKPSVKLAV